MRWHSHYSIHCRPIQKRKKGSTRSPKVRTSKLSVSHLSPSIFSSLHYLLFQLVMTQIIMVPFYLVTRHPLHIHQIKSRLDYSMIFLKILLYQNESKDETHLYAEMSEIRSAKKKVIFFISYYKYMYIINSCN